MHRRLVRISLLFTSVASVAAVMVPVPCLGEDRPGKEWPGREWDVTLGAGAAIRPTYEGSDQYIASPAPLVNVVWRDAVALGVDGLSAYWRYQNLRVGGGLGYGTGRTQSSGAFQAGDSRLTGMGDIPAALALKAFVDYRLGPESLPVTLRVAVTKFTANGNDGTLLNFGAALPYKLTPSTTIRAVVSADWADQDYVQTFFGVTPIQSINSGYAQYSPGAGIKDVNFGLGLTQQLTSHWALLVNASVERLTGDAAGSPIVFSKTQAVVMSAISYHF
jgi:outer membrane scaffolding protein for murein synthesis (MipA/OmpV family)